MKSQQVPRGSVAREVKIQVNMWSRREYIEVIPSDDYDFVVRLDFLDSINVVLVFTNVICVLDK